MADTYEKFLQTFVIFFRQTFVFVPKNQNNFFPSKKITTGFFGRNVDATKNEKWEQ